MPVKSPPKERPLILMLLSACDGGAWSTAVPDWIEERIDGAVEVIARRSDGATHALLVAFGMMQELVPTGSVGQKLLRRSLARRQPSRVLSGKNRLA